MSYRKDFEEKLQHESKCTQERHRIEQVCRDFSRHIEEIYQRFIRGEYEGIAGLEISRTQQAYACRLGEFRIPDEFSATSLRFALYGKQVAVALVNPCGHSPQVHYVIAPHGRDPVDPEDPVHTRGLSIQKFDYADYTADTFDPDAFHKTLVEQLISKL